MEIEVRTYMVVNGNNISYRQLEVLAAINKHGSKTAAAKELGISPPVVHRYMEAMEEAAGTHLMLSTPNGTELTAMGLSLLEVANMMEERCSGPCPIPRSRPRSSSPMTTPTYVRSSRVIPT